MITVKELIELDPDILYEALREQRKRRRIAAGAIVVEGGERGLVREWTMEDRIKALCDFYDEGWKAHTAAPSRLLADQILTFLDHLDREIDRAITESR